MDAMAVDEPRSASPIAAGPPALEPEPEWVPAPELGPTSRAQRCSVLATAAWLPFLVLLAVLSFVFLPVMEWVLVILRWVWARDAWGALLLVAMYAPVGVVWGPSTALHVACGVLYGHWFGLLAAIAGYNLGASCGFLVGRYLLREQIVAWAQRHTVARLSLRVMDRRPAMFVVVCRVAPFLPWGPSNYLFSLSDVSYGHYCIATLPSSVPYCLVCVLAGVGLGDVAGLHEDDLSPTRLGFPFWGLVALGNVLMLGSGIWGWRYGRQLLREEERLEQIEQRALGAELPEAAPPGAAPRPGAEPDADLRAGRLSAELSLGP